MDYIFILLIWLVIDRIIMRLERMLNKYLRHKKQSSLSKSDDWRKDLR